MSELITLLGQSANDIVYAAWFYFLAAIVLAAACGVVFKRNLVHSALLLAVSFAGVAGLYILLEADFLAAVQLLVYSGAVAVIIVIGVMLTQREAGAMPVSSPSNRLRLPAALVALFLTGLAVWTVLATPWQAAAGPAPESAPAIAQSLLTDFVVAFEAAAILLLVAMIGAIILARGKEANKTA